MTLPTSTYDFTTEVKYYLRSYRAYFDVRFALENYPAEGMTLSRWKVYWAGVCSLLKTSIHMMRHDARSCLPGPLKETLVSSWNELRQNKSQYPLFWDFIDRERHNILKEYEFSAYETYLSPDGKQTYPSLLESIDLQGVLLIRGGTYDGRDALELAKEGASWVGSYLDDTMRRAGLDPDERVTSRQFLKRQTGQPDAPTDRPRPIGGRLANYLAGQSATDESDEDEKPTGNDPA